ncbi:MAG: hypothetical protein KAH22_02840 [Thiotrichaceae bacterium]|nr:hypothetical protein [Thiotrichaceae bacterium]
MHNSQDKTNRDLHHYNQFMQERFSESIADQNRQMDNLARQLLTVELAISGLFITVLKLVNGTNPLEFNGAVSFIFSCWFIALILNIMAMLPRDYNNVNPDSPDEIKQFFKESARFKLILLLPSLFLFIAGIAIIVYDLAA